MKKIIGSAFFAFLFPVVMLSACGSPTTPQPTATLQPATATFQPATATPKATLTPLPPTPTPTPSPAPPTATLDPKRGRVEGTIFRSDTNQPYTNTSVTLRNSTSQELLTTKTDSQGYFNFPSIEPDEEYGLSIELSFQHPVLSSCNTLKSNDTGWLFATLVKGGKIELTGADAFLLSVPAGEIIEKNLTLICE